MSELQHTLRAQLIARGHSRAGIIWTTRCVASVASLAQALEQAPDLSRFALTHERADSPQALAEQLLASAEPVQLVDGGALGLILVRDGEVALVGVFGQASSATIVAADPWELPALDLTPALEPQAGEPQAGEHTWLGELLAYEASGGPLGQLVAAGATLRYWDWRAWGGAPGDTQALTRGALPPLPARARAWSLALDADQRARGLALLLEHLSSLESWIEDLDLGLPLYELEPMVEQLAWQRDRAESALVALTRPPGQPLPDDLDRLRRQLAAIDQRAGALIQALPRDLSLALSEDLGRALEVEGASCWWASLALSASERELWAELQRADDLPEPLAAIDLDAARALRAAARQTTGAVPDSGLIPLPQPLIMAADSSDADEQEDGLRCWRLPSGASVEVVLPTRRQAHDRYALTLELYDLPMSGFIFWRGLPARVEAPGGQVSYALGELRAASALDEIVFVRDDGSVEIGALSD